VLIPVTGCERNCGINVQKCLYIFKAKDILLELGRAATNVNDTVLYNN
jgi:hypothetical protein